MKTNFRRTFTAFTAQNFRLETLRARKAEAENYEQPPYGEENKKADIDHDNKIHEKTDDFLLPK